MATTSSPLTGEDNKSQELDSENCTSITYHLPQWFIKHRVAAAKPLSTEKSQIHLSDSDSPGDQGRYPNKVPRVDGQPQTEGVPPRYTLPDSSFKELRDTTAATFIANQYRRLVPSESSVVIRWSDETPLAVSDAVVAKLSQSLQVKVISVDLEDLEDLALDFNQQDEEAGRHTSGFAAGIAQAEWYFSPEKQEEKPRHERTISSILDVAKWPDELRPSNGPDVPQINTSYELAGHEPSSRVVMIYLQDPGRLLSLSQGCQLLSTLHSQVVVRRSKGERMVLVTTEIIAKETSESYDWDWDTEYDSYSPFTKSASKVIKTSRLVPMNPPLIIGDGAKDAVSRINLVNLRPLKRLLRDRVPHAFHADELHPFSVWFPSPGKTLLPDQHTLWSTEVIRRAATQIIGLIWDKTSLDQKPSLNIKDITAILVRMGLHVQGMASPQLACGNDESEDESHEDKVKRVRKPCSHIEKDLLDTCLINPDSYFPGCLILQFQVANLSIQWIQSMDTMMLSLTRKQRKRLST